MAEFVVAVVADGGDGNGSVPSVAEPWGPAAALDPSWRVALEGAVADAAAFDPHWHAPSSVGTRRDRRPTLWIRRLWGFGLTRALADVPCRLQVLDGGRTVYSVGLPATVLRIVRLQNLLFPLIILSLFLPLELESTSTDWLNHTRTSLSQISEDARLWYSPVPINACIGMFALVLLALQLSVYRVGGLPRRCGRLGSLASLAGVRGFHVMVSYGSEASSVAQSASRTHRLSYQPALSAIAIPLRATAAADASHCEPSMAPLQVHSRGACCGRWRRLSAILD